MSSYRLREPLGERPLAAADFPLTLGGPGASVLVPELAPGVIAAVIGLQDDELFLQPAADAAVRVAVAGQQITSSTWLANGTTADIGAAKLRVRSDATDWLLEFDHAGGGNVTEPPLRDETTAEFEGDVAPARQRLEAIKFDAPSASAPAVASRPRYSRATLLFGVAGALLFAVLAFFFTASSVTVKVAPDLKPDRVDFEGTWLDLAVAGHHLVLPGNYTLAVHKQGYSDARQAVTVSTARNQQFDVALKPLPGRVKVDTGGIAATIEVDGKGYGSVPAEIDVAAGERQIRVFAPRYAEYRGSLTVTGRGEQQQLAVKLVPGFAVIKIDSEPSGAAVNVDGVAIGVTPLSAELDAGRRTVTLTHPDFRAWETVLTVKGGVPESVGPVRLGLPEGQVTIDSSPSGADVSVAGAYRGRTPLRLSLVPDVAHEVMLTRAGYAAATRSVRLNPSQSERLSVALEPVLGEVEIKGVPLDAELFVDGKSRGLANQVIKLPAAAQTLEVRKAGLETFRVTITPRKGLRQSVAFELKTLAETRVAGTPRSVRTSLGQELRLMPVGSFQLGSQRREPGRRSNETQRPVELRRLFYLGTREVTNAEFRQFRAAHTSGIYKQETLDLERYPAVALGWQEAAEFCNWLSAKDGLPAAYLSKGGKLVLADPVGTGYRLPTEAEWEFAARWDGGRAERKYPWGSVLPVPTGAGNFADATAEFLQGVILQGYNDGFRVAAPVGSFGANPLGLFDMGGNVSEWTNDYYSIYPDQGGVVAVDPRGPADGQAYVIRGSNWLTANISELRVAYRDAGSTGRPTVGFRLARYAE